MYEIEKENVIEFINTSKTAGVSFYKRKYITKIEKLAESHPDEVEIIARNEDGSITANIPVSWVKISPPRTMSEEQKQAAAERLKKMREVKKWLIAVRRLSTQKKRADYVRVQKSALIAPYRWWS